jgi:acetyltransferase-like isoleucine patch superfamily enzyme
VTIGQGAVVGLGAIATCDVPAWRVLRAGRDELGVRNVDGRSM